MRRSEAEDAGGLTPVKDDNEAAPHFTRRTLRVFNCFDDIFPYWVICQQKARQRSEGLRPASMGRNAQYNQSR